MCEGTWNGIDLAENRVRMERGELYTAFTPDLVALRRKAAQACAVYNREATEVSRRQQVELLRQCITTLPELPPAQEGEDEDEALKDFPWFEPPFKVDYAERFEVGRGTFANFNLVVLNTCKVTVGSGCLFGPNVGLYAATHPIDPAIRQGTAGPELGGPIEIGDNCWFGGSITVLPNVKIGTGVVVGAGSVVTKSIPPFVVVAGVPAKIIKKVESEWATAYFKEHPEEEWFPPAKEITGVFPGREGR